MVGGGAVPARCVQEYQITYTKPTAPIQFLCILFPVLLKYVMV